MSDWMDISVCRSRSAISVPDHTLPLTRIVCLLSLAALCLFVLLWRSPDFHADGGAHFQLTPTQITFSTVVACASAPTHAYGLTGTTIYASTDGGQTWRPTATTSHHPGVLAADPDNSTTAYVGLSYPLGVEVTSNAGRSWRQVLP